METNNLYNLMTRFVRYVGIVVASFLFVVLMPLTAQAADGNITATAGANGAISPAGTVVVPEGTDQAFTITPDVGYHVDDVLVDSVSEGAISSYTFTAVSADHTIHASFAIDQFTITASAGSNGSIAPSGSVTVDYGNDQSFTITPDSGYEVSDVSVDGSSIGATTTYAFTNVLADHTIDATFSVIATATATHTVTATAGANGTITPSGAQIVTEGDDITFTIAPDSGYEIATLTVDGATTTPTTTYAFTNVLADHTIDATFSAIPVHTITVISGSNGTVTPSGATSVFNGGSLTLTITPDSGYTVGTLIVDSVIVSTTTSYTFTNVTGDHTLSASFIPTYSITATSGTNGTIIPTGSSTVSEGGSVTYTITPDSGYGIATVTVDGVTTTATSTYTFTNVTAPHIIIATFLPLYDLVASAGANGTISPLGTTTVMEGSNFTTTITPDSGFGIATLTVDGIPVSTTTAYTFTNVTAPHTISVTFLPLYTVVVSASGQGTASGLGTTTVMEGSNFTTTITPDSGYAIGTMTIDGATTTPTTTHTFTAVTGNHTVDVTFVELHAVTVITGTNGTVTPSGTTDVREGDDLTLTITPDSGYTVGTLIVDSISVPTTTSYTFTNVTGDHTLSATFVPVYTITATAGSNGTITPSGTLVILEGSDQSFTITPNTGFGIATVTIDGTTTTPTTTHAFTNVTANHTIDATFLPLYDLVATANTGGTISLVGTTTVMEGSDVTYTITPTLGYGIGTLMVDGVTTTPVTTYTFTGVTSGHTIDVTFIALPIYTIIATAGENGTISPTGTTSVTHGDNQTFTINPAYGYGVATLSIDGVTTTPATTYTFTNVQNNHTIDATFVLLPTHTILATAGGNGTVSPVGTTTVFEGANQMFFITPAFGFSIGTITIDGVPVPDTNAYTFVNVMSDHTIDVTFTALPVHTITASSGANGTISPSGATLVYETYDQTFTFTPTFGYIVTSLLVDGTPVGTTTSYTFTNVTSDHTVEVTFGVLPTHTITSTAGTNGTISPVGATSVPETYDQTFVITPDTGFGIAALIVDGVTTTATTSYTFTNVTANHTIDVTFTALPTHTITANAGANGTITPSGIVVVFETYDQTFTITPDYGYGIASLTVDGTPVGTTTSYTFMNVTASHTLSVTFFLLPTHTVIATAGSGGNISSPGTTTVVEGENQTYTITPDYGYTVGTLTVDGVTTTPTTTVAFTNVTGDHTVDVGFVLLPTHTITGTTGGHGTISPLGATTVYDTYNQTFTFTPDGGYSVYKVIVDGVEVTPSTSYTFTNVTADHTIDVSFVKSSSGGSSGSGGGKKKTSEPMTREALLASLMKKLLDLRAQVALLPPEEWDTSTSSQTELLSTLMEKLKNLRLQVAKLALEEQLAHAGATSGTAVELTSRFFTGSGYPLLQGTSGVSLSATGTYQDGTGTMPAFDGILDTIYIGSIGSDMDTNDVEMTLWEKLMAYLFAFMEFIRGLFARLFGWL